VRGLSANEIEDQLKQLVHELITEALRGLSHRGLIAGATVETLAPYASPYQYRLTRIDVGLRETMLSISCYGNKLRRDGTFGTHDHYVGRPRELMIIRHAKGAH